MVYTEIKQRNNRRYYYRVISLRKGLKVMKKRLYLGVDLDKSHLINLEHKADKVLLVNNKLNEIDKVLPKIRVILGKYGVKRAGIFGSFARGTQRKNSDIDILVSYPKGLGFRFIELNEEIEKALKKKVDLLTYKGINPYLKRRILSEEKRIL